MTDSAKKTEGLCWQKIYDFILVCSKAHNQNTFAITVMEELRNYVDYDQAIAYFLDVNGKVYDRELIDVDYHWSTMYLQYFSTVEEGQYDVSAKKNIREKNTPVIHNWDAEMSEEFIPYYIKQKGLKYSCGFSFADSYGNPRIILSLDRKRKSPFMQEDISFLKAVIPVLSNIHENLIANKVNTTKKKDDYLDRKQLTNREKEIVDLLSKGMKPSHISKILHISQQTTYKHISHIYEKMKVSSLQELLVILLNPS